MLISIIESLISIFIMYKCCEKFEFKITWLIYTSLYVLFFVLSNGFSHFFFAVILYDIISAIVVLIYYKIYDHCNYSFWKFFGLSLLVQLVIIVVLIVIGTFISMLMGNNGILA